MAGKRLKALVIVESPTKAKKIGGYLGPNYKVLACVGHIRDLPAGAAQVPAALKKEAWAKIDPSSAQTATPATLLRQGSGGQAGTAPVAPTTAEKAPAPKK